MRGNFPWTPDLAFIRIEIIFPLRLAVGDAADPTPVMPGSTVIITEQTEDTISLQCPMATHNKPALPRLTLFLWEAELDVTEEDSAGAQRQG